MDDSVRLDCMNWLDKLLTDDEIAWKVLRTVQVLALLMLIYALLEAVR